jgi:hypothetical protein
MFGNLTVESGIRLLVSLKMKPQYYHSYVNESYLLLMFHVPHD